jgi:hypothetical protein
MAGRLQVSQPSTTQGKRVRRRRKIFRSRPGFGKTMAQDGGKQQNTAYGVFVQACWVLHKRQYPDELIHIEEFNKQSSDWWYDLSKQERKRFQKLADRSNKTRDKELCLFLWPTELVDGERGLLASTPTYLAQLQPQSARCSVVTDPGIGIQRSDSLALFCGRKKIRIFKARIRIFVAR